MAHTSVTVSLWLGMAPSSTLQINALAHHLQLDRVTHKQHNAFMSLHRLRGAQAPAKKCTHHSLVHKIRNILSTPMRDNEQATRTPTWRPRLSIHGQQRALANQHATTNIKRPKTGNQHAHLLARRRNQDSNARRDVALLRVVGQTGQARVGAEARNSHHDWRPGTTLTNRMRTYVGPTSTKQHGSAPQQKHAPQTFPTAP